jgi:putative membrane protein insertion efficiency factor
MKAAVQSLLAGYKRWISPLLPASCRFVPTCSEYALEAVEQHGVIMGGLLSAWRILRCQPFARSGFDPVPHNFCSRPARHRCALDGTPNINSVTR